MGRLALQGLPDSYASRFRRGLFIVETVQSTTFYLFTEDAFDAVHHVLVFANDEREGIAGLRSAACAADPVCVGVGGGGHVIVNNMRYT